MSKKIEKANITDKDGNDVFFGDRFIIETPNASKGGKRRIAKVIKDTSEENSFCHRNYDVEEENGDRNWNAYMIIKNNERIK